MGLRQAFRYGAEMQILFRGASTYGGRGEIHIASLGERCHAQCELRVFLTSPLFIG